MLKLEISHFHNSKHFCIAFLGTKPIITSFQGEACMPFLFVVMHSKTHALHIRFQVHSFLSMCQFSKSSVFPFEFGVIDPFKESTSHFLTGLSLWVPIPIGVCIGLKVLYFMFHRTQSPLF